jgi:hypothetical protein
MFYQALFCFRAVYERQIKDIIDQIKSLGNVIGNYFRVATLMLILTVFI